MLANVNIDRARERFSRRFAYVSEGPDRTGNTGKMWQVMAYSACEGLTKEREIKQMRTQGGSVLNQRNNRYARSLFKQLVGLFSMFSVEEY